MKRSTRFALVVLVGFLLVVGVAAGAVAHSLRDQGMIVVRVEGDGDRISLSIPGAMLTTALNFAPRVVWQEFDDQVCHDMRSYMEIAGTALRELAVLPDAVLVTVRDEDESVRIEKRNGAMIVMVNSDDERVFVSVPMGTMKTLVSAFDRKVLAI
ncbi:MAG: hypothetical protein HKN20_17190 [Gemmatimonadetes bacterium]|nr:hypothetical protein [Gemmatimonadota bacterium]